MTYWRPFAGSRGWKPLDITGVDLSPEERALHEELHNLRDEVHAHSDHNGHDQEPWVGPRGGPPINIVTAPSYHLHQEQLEAAIVVLDKLLQHYSPPQATQGPALPGPGQP